MHLNLKRFGYKPYRCINCPGPLRITVTMHLLDSENSASQLPFFVVFDISILRDFGKKYAG